MAKKAYAWRKTGPFNLTDVFTWVVCKAIWPNLTLVSGDEPDPKSYVVFGLCEWDPDRRRFGDIPPGGLGPRAKQPRLASLVWAAMGARYCAPIAREWGVDPKELASRVGNRIGLVCAIDREVYGPQDLVERVFGDSVSNYGLSSDLCFPAACQFDRDGFAAVDAAFGDMTLVMSIVLRRAVMEGVQGLMDGRRLKRLVNGPILILEEQLPWEDHVDEFPGLKVVVEQRRGSWFVTPISDVRCESKECGRVYRSPIPKCWLRPGDLSEVTGIAGVRYKDRVFLAQSRKDAEALAELIVRGAKKAPRPVPATRRTTTKRKAR